MCNLLQKFAVQVNNQSQNLHIWGTQKVGRMPHYLPSITQERGSGGIFLKYRCITDLELADDEHFMLDT